MTQEFCFIILKYLEKEKNSTTNLWSSLCQSGSEATMNIYRILRIKKITAFLFLYHKQNKNERLPALINYWIGDCITLDIKLTNVQSKKRQLHS